MQFRHGDLLIERVESIPARVTARKSGVIAEGEATGHAHRVAGGAAVLEAGSEVYVRADDTATVVHEEHATITLPAGEYRVIRQREYDPYERAARQVAD